MSCTLDKGNRSQGTSIPFDVLILLPIHLGWPNIFLRAKDEMRRKDMKYRAEVVQGAIMGPFVVEARGLLLNRRLSGNASRVLWVLAEKRFLAKHTSE